jgi:hypothetical protein
VPDYIITIHLKIGKPKMGVRWHPSYDLEHVKSIVEQKVKLALGMAVVVKVDVALAPVGFRKKNDAKPLVQ